MFLGHLHLFVSIVLFFSSSELADEDALAKFTKNADASIVGFFAREDELQTKFMSIADSLREKFRFAHTNDVELMNTYGRR